MSHNIRHLIALAAERHNVTTTAWFALGFVCGNLWLISLFWLYKHLSYWSMP